MQRAGRLPFWHRSITAVYFDRVLCMIGVHVLDLVGRRAPPTPSAPLLRPAHGPHTRAGRRPQKGRMRDAAARPIRAGRMLTKLFGALEMTIYMYGATPDTSNR